MPTAHSTMNDDFTLPRDVATRPQVERSLQLLTSRVDLSEFRSRYEQRKISKTIERFTIELHIN